MTVTTGKKGKPKDFKNKNPELTKVTPKKRTPPATKLEIEEALIASGGFISSLILSDFRLGSCEKN